MHGRNPRVLPVLVVRGHRCDSIGGVPEFEVVSSELVASGQRGPAGLVVCAIWASAALIAPEPPAPGLTTRPVRCLHRLRALRLPPVRRGLRPPSTPSNSRPTTDDSVVADDSTLSLALRMAGSLKDVERDESMPSFVFDPSD